MSSPALTNKPATKKTPVVPTVGVVVELTAGGDTATLSMERTSQTGTAIYRGSMPRGQRLRLGAVLEETFEIDALSSMQALTITQLSLEMRPALDTYAFSMGITNVWALEIATAPGQAPLTFSVDRVLVALKKSPQETRFFLKGDFSLLGGSFSVSLSRIVTTTPARGEWVLVAKARNIQLAPLVNRLLGDGKLTGDFGLDTLTIQTLELTLIQEKIAAAQGGAATTRSFYRFFGAIAWNFTIAGESINIAASADIKNYAETRVGNTITRTPSGISGRVAGSIELFNRTVKASIFYDFSQGPQATTSVGFEIRIKSFVLNGLYSKSLINGRQTEIITFGFSGIINIGDIISYVVSLFDPSLEDFELDAPWDALGKQSIDLSKLTASIDLTNSRFTFSYAIPLDLGLFKITGLGLSYGKVPGGTQYRPNISLNLVIPGLPKTTESWDPVNENPPNIPGKGVQVFDLQFLAIGQRVTFAPEIVSQARNITQVMTVLRQTMGVLPPAQRRQNPLEALQAKLPSPAPVSIDPTATITLPEGSSPIVFNPNSGILLGAQFSIMDTLDMSVIFNDPLIYGLRISMYGAKAKLFAGLQFEILYRKVSDTVGVYHLELALPDAMRQFDVGALAVTLPIVVIDIYTNGDFAIDFGFPWKGDFSRSFAIQGFAGPFPVIGAGGFYFAKLSAETATSTPAITNGTFSPVYEFGLGLKIGLGRSFNKGPLKAEISITIRGIIQGVVARFNPSDPSVASDDYFKIQGGVSLVGRLYGSVDFKIISVEVEVLLRATVLFVVEAYQPTLITLEAEVSVRASVKVLFVRIRFSFKLVVRQSFTIGSASPTPWKLAPAQPTSETRSLSAATGTPIRRTAHFAPAAFSTEAFETEAFSTETSTTEAFSTEAFDAQPFDVAASRTTASRTIDVTADDVTAFNTFDEAPPSSRPDFAVRSFDTAVSFDSTTNFSAGSWSPIKLPLPGDLAAEQKAGDKLRVDLYFQPGFTQVGGAVQGVGLLFIENSISPDEDDPDKFAENANSLDTDFDELVKALLKWTVHSYTGSADTSERLTLADWEALYNQFVAEFETATNTPRFLTQLIAFLENNVVFDISDRVGDDPQQNKELSGTFFPMLPQLNMALDGATPVDFQAEKFQRSLDQLQAIKSYLKALQVRPGSTLENSAVGIDASTPVSGGTEQRSLCEYLFVDYFLLLIRSGLQSAVSYLEDNGDNDGTSTAPTVDAVLTELNRNGAFNHLAGTASRYFLHGLRLPTPTDEPVHQWETTALYKANGQQFDVSISTGTAGDGTATTTVNLNEIALTNPANLSWVRFIDYDQTNLSAEPTRNAPSLTLVLTDSQKAFLRQLKNGTPSLPRQLGGLLPFYKPTPRQYTLRQRIPLTNRDELRELPADLRAYLQNKSAIPFTLTSATNKEADALTERQVTWATKLKVSVQQLGAANTYSLVGTDEVGKDLLEMIRATGDSAFLDLLYLDKDSGELIQPTRDVLLLKTNLSTRSQSASSTTRSLSTTADTFRAQLPPNETTDGTPFLQLLWECSTVNSGGYYLSYPEGSSLPDALFTDGTTAELVLLIRVNQHTQQAHKFHNCVKLTTVVEADLLATRADTTDPVQALQMPAGHLGIQLTRPNASRTFDDGDANDELENLYQLLGYRLQPSDGFRATPDGLPIGPSDDSDDSNHPWQYERVIPVYTLATEVFGPTGGALPAPTLSPYRGVSETAAIQPQLEWRDLYGNTFTQFQPTPLPVRYFDPLLGVNQWPGLIERYLFSKEPNQPADSANLTISFQLDTSQYIPTPGNRFEDVQRKTRAARELYQQVFYQIHRPDVSATLETSVLLKDGDPVQTEILDKARPDGSRAKPELPEFVNEVYRYLATLEELAPLQHEVRSRETFTSIATEYRIAVDNLAEENQSLSDLWAPGTPLEIPVERDIAPADRLRFIAGRIIQLEEALSQTARSSDEIIDQLLSRHTDTPGLVMDGLSLENDTYTTQPGDTLTEIAAAINKSVGELTAILEGLPASTSYLDDTVVLSVPVTCALQSGDSLASIKEKVQTALKNDLSIGLDAALLTVKDVALATSTTLLSGATKTLSIPGQIRLAGQGLPSQITTNVSTLRELVAGLQRSLANTSQRIDIAAVVTTNQTLTGVIKPGVPLQGILQQWLNVPIQQFLERWQSLDTNVPTDIINRVQNSLTMVTANVATLDHETFHSLVTTFEQVRQALVDVLDNIFESANSLLKDQGKQLRSQLSRKVSLAEVAIAIQNVPLLIPSATLIKPPYTLSLAEDLALPEQPNDATVYPSKLIFPVSVQVTVQRDAALISDNVPDKRLVQTSTAYLAPHTTQGDSRSAALTDFAQNFQNAFPGLRLATSDNRNPGFPGDPNGPSQSLWAVRLGKGGLTYDIAPSAPPNNPFFFAPKPLANTLMAGVVDLKISTPTDRAADSYQPDEKRFDAIDLNLLAQNFLRAVEDFLAPKVSIPAVRLEAAIATNVDQILAAKDDIADAISGQVVPLLQLQNPPSIASQTQAAEALKQELQINLAEAYAIETIVQYGVTVTNQTPALTLEGDFPVRLSGQPILASAQDATEKTPIDTSILDFTLSPAKVSLEPSSFLTFFFNTQNPEKYEDIELNLTFSSNEIEYNIKSVDGIEGYQASDWLSFIIPDAPDPLGDVQIPIPLRTYPIPPSLVVQQAELDPDAIGDDLAKVREWQYVYTYEHLDVAQDSLESDVQYNLTGIPSPAALGIVEDSSAETLFDALVRFNQKYPELQKTFEQLAAGEIESGEPIEKAKEKINNFAKLVRQVADTWATWQPPELPNTQLAGVDYVINEEEPPVAEGEKIRKEVTIEAPIRDVDPVTLPEVKLPGFQLTEKEDLQTDSNFQKRLYKFIEKTAEAAALDPIFGESSIPDRTLIIQDRDIIAQQNAWSGIWLTRNRELVPSAPTNPAFVFQTPQVRFSNWVTPLLVNSRPWNIADLSTPAFQSLFVHLKRMFETVLPANASQGYGLRVDCRYAFAVATVDDEQLFSTVPVLLTPRIDIEKNQRISESLLSEEGLVKALAREIYSWRNRNNPVEKAGRYQLTLNLFSGLKQSSGSADSTLPILKIEQLFIQQADVNWE
ncbi:MAG: LysM peptidoglycan-binding domain-containing protein [Cyanobacteria bacterium J06621_3]